MTRGVWIAAVALGLGGTLPHLAAQEARWLSIFRPGARAAKPAPKTPAVQMGRPVAIMRGSSAGLDRTPRSFPPAYLNNQAIPMPRVPEPGRPAEPAHTAQAIATVAPPGAVIAASSSQSAAPAPQAVDQGEDGPPNELFAMDRPQQVVRGPDPAPGGLRPAANWKEVYPVEVKPEPGVGPAFAPAHPPALPHAVAPSPMPVSPEALSAPPVPWWDQPGQGLWSSGRFYARAEYLLWWLRNAQAPPLVTTGDLNVPGSIVPPVRIPGALDQPDTVSLFDGDLTRNPFSGARFTAGFFLGECGDKAIEVGGFFLPQRSRDFAVSSAQVPFLARPFFAANPGPVPILPRELVEVVAFPGAQAGTLRINAPSQLWGLNADLVCKVCCGCDFRFNVLFGGRYLNLRESLTITEDIQTAATNARFMGARVFVSDSFATRNEFYGAEAGVSGRYSLGRFDVDGFAKLAVGSTRQTVEINGFQTVTRTNGQVDRFVGGLLALDSNIGTFSRDKFSVVPEVGVSLGYNVTDRVRVSAGYNFLYWSSVVRPGDQIDRNLDILRIPNFGAPAGTQPVNPPRPAVPFKDSDFWAHGLTAGLELKF